MNAIRSNIGPFELFSSFVSGIPLLTALLVVMNFAAPFDCLVAFRNWEVGYFSGLLLILLAYIMGALITGLTWRYFKLLCRIFSIEYQLFNMREFLVAGARTRTVSKRAFLKMDFTDRMRYLLEKRFGIDSEITGLEVYSEDSIRNYIITVAPEMATRIESLLAHCIMHRKISFGLLIIALVFAARALTIGGIENIGVAIASLVGAALGFWGSVVFRRWANRKCILGFYNFEISKHIESADLFKAGRSG